MGMSCLDCHDFMDGFNRGKKEGTIEELETIKEKIKNLTYYWCEVNPNSVKDDVLEIIDKRITELKGE